MIELPNVAAVLALGVAGAVKGATGIGFATLALPLLTQIVGLKAAMALIVVPTLATNAGLALSGNHLREILRSMAPLYLAMIPGVLTGAMLLRRLDAHAAAQLLGWLVLVFVLQAVCKPTLTLTDAGARCLRAPVGFLSGAVTGLTGSQVFPLVPYLMSVRHEPQCSMQAINIGVLVLSSTLGLTLVAGEQGIDGWQMSQSVFAALPALAGAALGAHVRGRLSVAIARQLVLLILALSGLKLIVG